MKIAPNNTPNQIESVSAAPSNTVRDEVLRHISDIIVVASGNDEFIEQKTDELLNPMGEENSELFAEVLFELACSDNPTFHEIAANNVGYLYAMNPDVGRPLWELMVTTDGTAYTASDRLSEYMTDETDGPFTRREIEDYAAIKRCADEYEALQQSQQ